MPTPGKEITKDGYVKIVGDGFVKWFLVIENEGEENEFEHYCFSHAQVQELIRKNDELAIQGHDVPGLSFYTVIQPITTDRQDEGWSFAEVGELEKAEGCMTDVKAASYGVYRGMPCEKCGKQEWQANPPNPQTTFLCGNCNRKI